MTLYRTTIEIEIEAPAAEVAKQLADGIATVLEGIGIPIRHAWHHDEGLYPIDVSAPREEPPEESA